MPESSPHTIVLVFDNPESTAALRQVLVTHESLDVHVAYANDIKPPEQLQPITSKQMVATKLGRRAKAAESLLAKLAERFGHGGPVAFTTEEVASFLSEAAEDSPAPVVLDVSNESLGGFVYEDPLPEAEASEAPATGVVPANSEGKPDSSREVTLSMVRREEDAA